MKKISITWSAALLLSLLLLPLLFLTHGGLLQASAVSRASPLPRLQPPTPNTDTKKWQDFLKAKLTYFSTPVMLKLAEKLGVTQIKGKSVVSTKTVAAQQVRTSTNILVASSPYDDEEEPSIAVNPMEPKEVLAFLMDYTGYGCAIWYSIDAGSSWWRIGPPPTSPNDIAGTDFCMDPVVRWSPDGLAAYFSYLSVRADVSTSDVVVTVDSCPPSGMCWATAVPLFPGTSTSDFWDRPWIDVHQAEAGDPLNPDVSYVYVTATYFNPSTYPNLIGFDVSSDYGATFTGFATALTPLVAAVPLVQFSRPMGGYGPWVLACWYNSEADGAQFGVFSIRCRSSPDNGASWNTEVTAARSFYELPYWLGPSSNYHVWWPSMGPSIAMSPDGRAHIAFTRDPTANQLDSESGDVMYTRTPTAYNYALWSTALPIGVSGQFAQGLPTIVVQQRPAFSPTPLGYRLYLFYISHHLSPYGINANILYDVFMRYSNNGGASWSIVTRITAQSSMNDYESIGDYMDSSATNRRAYVIWTDRADKLSIHDLEDDVFTEFIESV
jgi:hypothetical protein